MHSIALISMAILPKIVLGLTLDILVGQGGLNFNPNNITAERGDLLNFHFASAPHSVAQSTFSDPCVPLDRGIYSGQINVPGGGGMIFQINLTDTNPLWLYCAVAQHCKLGMAMVINPPVLSDTINAYQTAAMTARAIAPSSVQGGKFIKADQASSSSAASSESAKSVSTGTTPSSQSTAVRGVYGALSYASSANSAADDGVVNSAVILTIGAAAGYVLY